MMESEQREVQQNPHASPCFSKGLEATKWAFNVSWNKNSPALTFVEAGKR